MSIKSRSAREWDFEEMMDLELYTSATGSYEPVGLEVSISRSIKKGKVSVAVGCQSIRFSIDQARKIIDHLIESTDQVEKDLLKEEVVIVVDGEEVWRGTGEKVEVQRP